jgi:hypothetical protein
MRNLVIKYHIYDFKRDRIKQHSLILIRSSSYLIRLSSIKSALVFFFYKKERVKEKRDYKTKRVYLSHRFRGAYLYRS